jgi:hypothetical protein
LWVHGSCGRQANPEGSPKNQKITLQAGVNFLILAFFQILNSFFNRGAMMYRNSSAVKAKKLK